MGATAARGDEPGVNVAGLSADGPTQQFVGATVGDRCAACGTQLATDQKYCLDCGERHHKPPVRAQDVPRPGGCCARCRKPTPEKQRVSSGTALVAGVGTLLLALGVGVLIGHTDSGSSKSANAPAQIITVGGTAGGTSTGAAAATTAGQGQSRKGQVLEEVEGQ